MMNENIARALDGMRKAGFEVIEVPGAKEAREELLRQISPEESVGVGGSMTVAELGILPLLEQKGCRVYCHTGAKPEDVAGIQKQAQQADVYLCSANAVTSSGALVLVDGRGNRVSSVCNGPAHLIFVVSHSKFVDGGMSTAMARVKQIAAPLNCKRLGLKNRCAEEGVCAGNDCARSICNLTLSVDRVPGGRKVTVIVTEEALGY